MTYGGSKRAGLWEQKDGVARCAAGCRCICVFDCSHLCRAHVFSRLVGCASSVGLRVADARAARGRRSWCRLTLKPL